jgi:hypothetical protein
VKPTIPTSEPSSETRPTSPREKLRKPATEGVPVRTGLRAGVEEVDRGAKPIE